MDYPMQHSILLLRRYRPFVFALVAAVCVAFSGTAMAQNTAWSRLRSATARPSGLGLRRTGTALRGRAVSWRRLVGPRYQRMSATAKRNALWAATEATRYAPGEMPPVRDDKLHSALQLLNFVKQIAPFIADGDARPPHDKPRPFGATTAIAWEPVAGHGYTGVFASGGEGLARLSLAPGPKGSLLLGMGVKITVSGQHSLDVLASNGLDGTRDTRDFFTPHLYTNIPPPHSVAGKAIQALNSIIADPLRRPVDHLAHVESDGSHVANPRAPYELVFETPADGPHFASDTTRDFRDEMHATVAPGTVLYNVYAKSTRGSANELIGRIRTTSPIVASSFADRSLSFHHRR
jgi:hypothetical protein